MLSVMLEACQHLFNFFHEILPPNRSLPDSDLRGKPNTEGEEDPRIREINADGLATLNRSD